MALKIPEKPMEHAYRVVILALMTLAVATVASAQSNFSVAVTADGSMVGYFSEVGDIGSQSEVVENQITNPDTGEIIIRKVPGRLTWFDVTLTRGISAALDVWEWRQMVVDGNVIGARKQIAIMLYDATGTEVARWNGSNCWPNEVRAGSGTTAAVEKLVLACEGIERVAAP